MTQKASNPSLFVSWSVCTRHQCTDCTIHFWH